MYQWGSGTHANLVYLGQQSKDLLDWAPSVSRKTMKFTMFATVALAVIDWLYGTEAAITNNMVDTFAVGGAERRLGNPRPVCVAGQPFADTSPRSDGAVLCHSRRERRGQVNGGAADHQAAGKASRSDLHDGAQCCYQFFCESIGANCQLPQGAQFRWSRVDSCIGRLRLGRGRRQRQSVCPPGH